MDEVDPMTLLVCYFSLVMYLSLVGLNFFWFNKMFQGLLKFFKKSKPEKSAVKED